jgi:hypothetical protein
MATKLYLRTTTANAGSHAAPELSTVLSKNGTGTEPTAVVRDLSTTAGAGAQSTLVATLQSSTVVGQRLYLGKWLSPVLLGGDIAANTWTVAFSGLESSSNANQIFGVVIYVLTSGDTVRGFVTDNNGSVATGIVSTELPLAQAGRVNSTVTGAAVTGVVSTDVLAVEAWTLGTESVTAGAYTITFGYNSTADPVDGTGSTTPAAYIQTPQDNLFTSIVGIPDVVIARTRT